MDLRTRKAHAKGAAAEQLHARPARSAHRTLRTAIGHPGRTFDQLANAPARPGLGVSVTATVAVLYALVAAGLALLEHEPMVQPWLRIPPDRYYEAQALFTLPVVLATVVAGTGVFHLVARAIGGRSDFDHALVAVAIAYALPTLLMWTVEAVSVGLVLTTPLTTESWLAATSSGLGGALVAAYQYVAFAWYGLLFVLAARRTARLNLPASLVVAVAALVTIGLLQFTFIR